MEKEHVTSKRKSGLYQSIQRRLTRKTWNEGSLKKLMYGSQFFGISSIFILDQEISSVILGNKEHSLTVMKL